MKKYKKLSALGIALTAIPIVGSMFITTSCSRSNINAETSEIIVEDEEMIVHAGQVDKVSNQLSCKYYDADGNDLGEIVSECTLTVPD